MNKFNENALEKSIMQLFQDEGYEYLSGDSVLRETSDVLLKDDLRIYLASKYISFEEKAFYNILEALAKKYNFYDDYIAKYGADHLLNLAKDIKAIVDDKAKYVA